MRRKKSGAIKTITEAAVQQNDVSPATPIHATGRQAEEKERDMSLWLDYERGKGSIHTNSVTV